MSHLQAFMYLSVHGAFRYGILAPFRHPQIDPPPPQPQYHLQGMEDHDQLPQRILPHAPGHLAASVSRNQIQRRRIAKPQQMATKVVVETLRTAERHHGDETDVQLCDTEQSLLNEFDVEEPMQSPTEVTGASANANTVWTEDSTTNTNLPQSQNKQAMEKKKHFQEEASKLTRPKPPAEKQPSQTAIKVTLKSNLIFCEYLAFYMVINLLFCLMLLQCGTCATGMVFLQDKLVNYLIKVLFSG